MQQRDGNQPPRQQNNGKNSGGSGKNSETPAPRSRIPSWAIAAVVVVILGFWAWNAFGRDDNGGRTTVDYSVLTSQIVGQTNASRVVISTGEIQADLISAISVNSDGEIAPSGGEGVTTGVTEIVAERPPDFDDQALVTALTASNTPFAVEGRQPSGSGFLTILLSFLPFLLFLGLILFMARSMGRGQQNVFGFGRSKARQHDPERPQVTFADVAGEDEAKTELTEVVDFLRNPAKYHALGARLPRGVLLVGPPGTGKTLLARAVAGEAGTPFYSVSASEFVEMFVGVGASRVRDLFEKAKASAPAIIFVDELDAVGRQRFAGLGGSNDEREQTLNQMLVEMDGFDTNQEVIVMAATNRPDVLDPALLRPGRFDRQVTIGLPDKRGREAILQIHSRGIPLASTIDLPSLARGTTGFSGADLANLVNEAALTAARRNRREITPSDFEEALDKILLGTTRNGLMNPKEREVVAYHEAGHAIVAHFTPGSDPLRKVSIVPRGRALGVTVQMPDEDRHNYSRTYLLGRLAMLLGGRAAEMVVYDEVTTGAESDLKEATSLARRMVSLWGMSAEVGPIYLGAGEEHVFLGREITQDKSFSDSTAQRMDGAIRDMVETALDRALEVNTRFRPQLDRLVATLLEKETIDGTEVTAIFGPATPEDPNAGMVPRQEQTRHDQQQAQQRVNAE